MFVIVLIIQRNTRWWIDRTTSTCGMKCRKTYSISGMKMSWNCTRFEEISYNSENFLLLPFICESLTSARLAVYQMLDELFICQTFFLANEFISRWILTSAAWAISFHCGQWLNIIVIYSENLVIIRIITQHCVCVCWIIKRPQYWTQYHMSVSPPNNLLLF